MKIIHANIKDLKVGDLLLLHQKESGFPTRTYVLKQLNYLLEVKGVRPLKIIKIEDNAVFTRKYKFLQQELSEKYYAVRLTDSERIILELTYSHV